MVFACGAGPVTREDVWVRAELAWLRFRGKVCGEVVECEEGGRGDKEESGKCRGKV